MLIPERMREVNLFIYEEDIQPVTLALAQLGVLQIEAESGTKESTQPAYWQSLATTYGTQERRLDELLATLAIARTATELPCDPNVEQDHKQLAATLQEAEAQITAWQQRERAAQQTLTHLHLLVEQLRLLAPMQIPVEAMSALQAIHLTVGLMPTTNLTRIQTALFRIPFTIIPAYQNGT
ncbi:MAG: hypothetical protein KDE53_16210, partial [Caldilineaceae bacterium]|nr:hypothetical protein [Caldilineaceae bacterium]